MCCDLQYVILIEVFIFYELDKVGMHCFCSRWQADEFIERFKVSSSDFSGLNLMFDKQYCHKAPRLAEKSSMLVKWLWCLLWMVRMLASSASLERKLSIIYNYYYLFLFLLFLFTNTIVVKGHYYVNHYYQSWLFWADALYDADCSVYGLGSG